MFFKKIHTLFLSRIPSFQLIKCHLFYQQSFLVNDTLRKGLWKKEIVENHMYQWATNYLVLIQCLCLDVTVFPMAEPKLTSKIVK